MQNVVDSSVDSKSVDFGSVTIILADIYVNIETHFRSGQARSIKRVKYACFEACVIY